MPPCGGDQPPVTRPGPDSPGPGYRSLGRHGGGLANGSPGMETREGREIFPGQQRGDMGDMSGVTWALEILQSQQPYRVN